MPAAKKARATKTMATKPTATKAAAKKATAKKATAKKAAASRRTSSGQGRGRNAAPRETCFVMSPFGGWYDQYYSDIYCPAVESAGLQPHRADDLYLPSAIVQDIWTYVKSARVMLADLTGKNPNVFYELGLAHAVDKPVVLLAQSMEDVPFDLRALRVITYEIANPGWGELLRTKITAALQEVLAAPETAVLQPFHRDATTTRPTESTDSGDQALQSLRRDVNQLKSELLLAPQRVRGVDIGPDEATRRIRALVREGVSDDVIVEMLDGLGPPRHWILSEIEDFRRISGRSSGPRRLGRG